MLLRIKSLPPAALAILLAVVWPLQHGRVALANNCNGNVSDDLVDINEGSSPDCNENGIPDSCELVPSLRLDAEVELIPGRAFHVVASADFQGDGRLDVAIGGRDHNILAILRNSGAAPFFTEAHDVMLPVNPSVLECGDLDRDGDVDLLVTNWSVREISFLRNDGRGAFGAGPSSDTQLSLEALELIDKDADGDLDAVVGPSSQLSCYYYLNAGDGRLTRGDSVALQQRTQAITAADVDGDRDTDLAFSEQSAHSILENDGGTFRLRELQIWGFSGKPTALDVDGDDRQDLIASVSVFESNCMRGLLGPKLSQPGRLSTIATGFARLNAMAAGDFDGDGQGELAAIPDADEREILLLQVVPGADEADVDGNGVPDSCDPLPGDCDADRVLDTVELETGAEPDCNANGVPDACDLAPKPAIEMASTLRAGRDPHAVVVADFDADGDADLATADSNSDALTVQRQDGPGIFKKTAYHVIADVPNVSSNAIPMGLAAGDLDGDGDLDLATGNNGMVSIANLEGSVTVFWNDGAGTFRLEGFLSISSGADSLAAGDLDGDGLTDLATAQRLDSAASVLLSQGNKRFLPAVAYRAESPLTRVVIADWNGDGAMDLAASGQAPAVTLFLNRGDGSLGRIDPAAIDSPFYTLVASDLDGDGRLDVIGSQYERSRLKTLLGQGDGRFLPSTHSLFEVKPTGLAVFDANADGFADVATVATTYNFLVPANVSLRFNDKQGGFGARNLFPVAGQPMAVTTGDLDGDKRHDIVCVSHDQIGQGQSAYISLLLNRSSSTSRDCNSNRIPDECDLARGLSTDLDGGGIPDECEPDCDSDGVPDEYEIATGAASDCDGSLIPDACEISSDRTPDCNLNGRPDACDLQAQTSEDCDADGVPDDCQADCNSNRVADACDLAAGSSRDCNGNNVPDECDVKVDGQDCDANSTVDACEITSQPRFDCDVNGILDRCEIASNPALDANGDGFLDVCAIVRFRRGDCDGDGRIAGSVTDAVILLRFNFSDGPAPPCLAACDGNGDGQVIGSVTDAVYLLRFNFLGGPPPAPPFPGCGLPGAHEVLGCSSYSRC